jgi:N12 class adenine-specific DNA methylase
MYFTSTCTSSVCLARSRTRGTHSLSSSASYRYRHFSAVDTPLLPHVSSRRPWRPTTARAGDVAATTAGTLLSSPCGSSTTERAFDMYLKVRHVQSANGGSGLVFATGTPIANSMAEMFTMPVSPARRARETPFASLRRVGRDVREPVTAMELSPDGAGYRLNTRFARFINVPELMRMFRQAADVQTAAMLNLRGQDSMVRSHPSGMRLGPAELRHFVHALAARADKLKTARVDPSVDNMLKITSEGRNAALDSPIIALRIPPPPGSRRTWQCVS